MASCNAFSCAIFNLIALFFCLQCFSLGSAQTDLIAPSSLNLTRLQTTDEFGVLFSTCEVADQIERIIALNITDYSESKHIQLQAMKITGAQVKENICDWMAAVINVDVLEGDSCSDEKLSTLCERARQHAESEEQN